MACRRPSSGGDGVCVAGVSTGMAAGSPSPRPLPDPGLWVEGLDCRPRAADSGSAAASIASLVSGRVARGSSGYTIPGLPPKVRGIPSLSIGTSHFENPRGQSREGFGVGLLRSR